MMRLQVALIRLFHLLSLKCIILNLTFIVFVYLEILFKIFHIIFVVFRTIVIVIFLFNDIIIYGLHKSISSISYTKGHNEMSNMCRCPEDVRIISLFVSVSMICHQVLHCYLIFYGKNMYFISCEIICYITYGS